MQILAGIIFIVIGFILLCFLFGTGKKKDVNIIKDNKRGEKNE